MSSSRPRRAASQPAALPASVRRGLASFVVGNEAVITAMLGSEATGRSDTDLVDRLAQVMAVNSLSCEMMLARFFDASVLADYAEKLGKSGKGPAATLAARIAKEWQRPDFGATEEAEQQPAALPAAPGGQAPTTAWTQPSWLALQSDSDDDAEEAERKRALRAELRKAKQQSRQQPLEQEPSRAAAAPSAAASSAASPDAAPTKRRKLDAAETASVLSQAAYSEVGGDGGGDEGSEEAPAAFDAAHYGSGGLNGRFEAADAIEFFAGGEAGGGGKFEDTEGRDIARNASALVSLMQQHGLRVGATVLDVGAGTGLMLRGLSAAVAGAGGAGGEVIALDLSSKFCAFLRRRVPQEGLANVKVQQCSAKSTCLPAGTPKAAFACVLDVYHHLEYPITFMRSVHDAMCAGGRLFLCDFHRDPARVTSMPGNWALEHIRADQATFRAEVERAGFRLVASPELPELRENYIMVFERL